MGNGKPMRDWFTAFPNIPQRPGAITAHNRAITGDCPYGNATLRNIATIVANRGVCNTPIRQHNVAKNAKHNAIAIHNVGAIPRDCPICHDVA